MDSLAETHQSSPSNQQPNIKMTELVCFNIGGNKYNLPHSFLKRYPQTLLGRIASEQWQSNTGKEVFLDQNGDYFHFVLSYLRNDGHVLLPRIFPKSLLLDELEYFEINDVDESKIVYDYHVFSTQSHMLMVNKNRSEIDSWMTMVQLLLCQRNVLQSI